jgi:hypothetical protein
MNMIQTLRVYNLRFTTKTVEQSIILDLDYFWGVTYSFLRDPKPKRCVKEGRRGRRTRRTGRRSGVKQQNVFSQRRFGDNNTDFHVACTYNPDMSLGIRETFDVLVVWRVQKSFFFRRSRFVSCVRTKVHMSSYELRPSLHTEFHEVCAHSWSRWCLEWPRDVFMSLGHSRHHLDPMHMTVSEVIETTVIVHQTPTRYTDAHDGLGSDWNQSDCTPDSDSVLLTPGLLTLLHLNDPSLRVSVPISLEWWENKMTLPHTLSLESTK